MNKRVLYIFALLHMTNFLKCRPVSLSGNPAVGQEVWPTGQPKL